MKQETRLKVVSYNIHKGFNSTNQRNVLDQIKQSVESLGADLVLLQEVSGHSITSQFEFIADKLWPHFAYGKNAVYTKGHHGNAILSRYPIRAWENLDLSQHRFEKRGLLHATIEVPNDLSPVHVFCTHLGLFEADRTRQAQLICERIVKSVPNHLPLILAGDFNDWRQVLSRSLSDPLSLKEAFQQMNGNYARTFPSWLPVLRLDRFYYRNVELLDASVCRGVPWSSLSDHLPMMVDLKLTPQSAQTI